MNVKVPLSFLYCDSQDFTADEVLGTVNMESEFWSFLGGFPDIKIKISNQQISGAGLKKILPDAMISAERAAKNKGSRAQGDDVPILPPRSSSKIASIIKNLYLHGNHVAVLTLLSPLIIKRSHTEPLNWNRYLDATQDIVSWIHQGMLFDDVDMEHIRALRKDAEDAFNIIQQTKHEVLRLRDDVAMQVSLSEPSKLWEDRRKRAADDSRSSFRKFSVAATLIGIGAIGFASCVYSFLPLGVLLTPSCHVMESGKEICKWVFNPAFGTVLCSFAIVFSICLWFLRAFHAEYRQSKFDANFYSEKLAFAESFRAMKSSGFVSKESEAIILSSLFREKPSYSQHRSVEVEGNPVHNIFNTIKSN